MTADGFPQDVQELQDLLRRPVETQRSRARATADVEVPIWFLGSSTFGAQLAGELGLAVAFASHFAPASLVATLDIYRKRFRPSRRLAALHAMVGVNIIAAESAPEARHRTTTQQMSFTNLLRGAQGLSYPPIDDIDTYWTAAERARTQHMLGKSIVGSRETVVAGIRDLASRTRADRLIVACDVYSHAARRRSVEIVADTVRGKEGEQTGTRIDFADRTALAARRGAVRQAPADA